MFTFKNLTRSFLAAALAIIFVGCIENDIPYPKIQPNFTEFEVAHQTRTAAIDSASRSVVVFLSEEADIENVEVLKWAITPGTVCADSAIFEKPIDLSSSLDVTLSLYQDYLWNISAIQEIERYFTIASLVGSSEIDVENHTVLARVPMQQPLTDISVKTLKLAGTTATYSPNLVGETVDFTEPVTVVVTEFGREIEWTITIEQTEVSVDLTEVNAWTCVAWLYGTAEEGKQNGFEYRLATDEEWTVLSQDAITHDGGSFVGRLTNLAPETQYVVRATSDDERSVERSFTTGSIVQVPNYNFTDWHTAGKVYNPWASGDESFWDTGNKGATTLGESNSIPIPDIMSPTGYNGARLQSKYIGLGMVGKLAAGNLFTGSYVRTEGTNGVLAFGREFTQRPTRITADITYQNVPISHASVNNPDLRYMKNQPDTGVVWCALIDCPEPFEIRTKPTDRNLFDPNADYVVAYGMFQTGDPISEFTTVTVDLEYKSTSRVPKWIIITASASKYGDFFTGGNGSVLDIRNVQLHYNY